MKSRTDRSVEKQFWIRACDDSVVALAAGANPELANGDIAAQTFDDFRRVTAEWALARFVGIWNRLPGKTPVRRFKDRATAVHRIWSGIQDISPEVPPPSDFIEPPEVTGREGTKKEHLLVLLARRDGASIAEVMAALGWQSHSIRGCLSTLSKKGIAIRSFRRSTGERAYSTAAPEPNAEVAD